MRFLASIIISFLFSTCLLSQALHFHSDFERKAFEDHSLGNPNYLELLVAASGNSSESDYVLVRSKLDELIDELNTSRFEGYSGSKKIKKIFNLIQEELLMKYQLENQFLEVFKSGKFNCVSSTAVYALLLDNFNIPYQIIEVPEHVYLIAQPDGQSIVMEGTDAQDGYLKLTENVVNRQLGTLVSMKVISEEEMDSPDLGNVIDELYPSESIGLEKLVAIQYYNQSIYDYENEQYLVAYENALKANHLFKNPLYRAMAYSCLGDYLSFRKFDEKDYGEYFATFAGMDTTKTHNDLVESEFHHICYSLLVEDPNKDVVNSIYNNFSSLSNKTLRNDLDFRYNVSMAGYFMGVGYHKDARLSLIKALSYNSENTDALSAFCSNILLGAEAGHFPEMLDTLSKYEEKFPALLGLNKWHDVSANISLVYCYNEMGVGNVSKANDGLSKFEKLMDTYPDIDVMKKNIGVTYCRVALNRYRTSKSQAQAIINKGLSYAPGNPDLIRMQRVFSQ
ncbi:hypothetical protein [Owenweeksia hongkongensis]|uniref:hypothetical protein n=1 Tax=Owenweeksia hongkongensis TaxID=253245 RepID=UPI003A9155B5